ncbi:MAG: DinB family protein [Actinomycetota bacterium]|nr:DinB family protein [Actinomycetota bacterium]
MTAPTRVDPPMIADEREMLDTWLDYHRETLALKCAELNPEQLRERSAPPSTLSLLGLVRHMAEVERYWFQHRLRGDEAAGVNLYCTDDNPDGDFDDVDTADPAKAFDTWRRECTAARVAVAEAESLDVIGKGPRHKVSLRWIMVHMIEEYARHNGHADLLRERIDGATGD